MAAPLPAKERGVTSVLTSGSVGGAKSATLWLLGRAEAEIFQRGGFIACVDVTALGWRGYVAELAATGSEAGNFGLEARAPLGISLSSCGSRFFTVEA